MKVQAARMLFKGIIGGQELQGSWYRVLRNIEEYPQNLLVKQVVIGNTGLSGWKWSRDPNVRVSKIHLTRIEGRSESQSIDEK